MKTTAQITLPKKLTAAQLKPAKLSKPRAKPAKEIDQVKVAHKAMREQVAKMRESKLAELAANNLLLGDWDKLKDGEGFWITRYYPVAAAIYERSYKKRMRIVGTFSGANMAVVAKELRQLYPYSPITICADLDPAGLGVRHAKAAVAAAGYSSFYTLPEFPDGRTSGTFLDLPQKAGND